MSFKFNISHSLDKSVVLTIQHSTNLANGERTVANEGLVLYIGGDYSLHLKC